MDAKTSLPALWGRATAETLARLTGAHLTTARRWKRAAVVPRWLAVLVRVVIDGELADLARAWAGWRIVDGLLISPEGYRFTPGELRAIPYLHAQLAAVKARAPVRAAGAVYLSGAVARSSHQPNQQQPEQRAHKHR